MEQYLNKIIQGDSLDVLRSLPSENVDMVVTSPPYWALRDYGVEGQLGLEPTFQEYITKLCDIFDEVKRVLKKEGTCWVNLGDTYAHKSESAMQGKNGERASRRFTSHGFAAAGAPDKCLLQLPSRFAIEMTNRGWVLRNEIIWHKQNCMPSSVKDRFTVDFEKLFFFVKSKKYHFETQYEPIAQSTIGRVKRGVGNHKNVNGAPGQTAHSMNKPRVYDENRITPINRNKRSVWKVSTRPFKEAHFATFPEALIETPILAGCPPGGVVLDMFMGAGTTGVVARKLGRNFIGIELNPEYIEIAEKRLSSTQLTLV